MLRIDRAHVPRGLTRSAKMYALILNDDGLYFLHLGPASGMAVRTKSSFEQGAVNFALNRVERKVKEGEERLAAASIDEWAKGKRSAFYSTGVVESAKVDTDYAGDPRLTIRAEGKKWKFIIPDPAVDTANELASRLNPTGSYPP